MRDNGTVTAYLIVPDVGSISGMTSTPFSTTLDTSNTASDIAVDNHTEASARCMPVRSVQSRYHVTSCHTARVLSVSCIALVDKSIVYSPGHILSTRISTMETNTQDVDDDDDEARDSPSPEAKAYRVRIHLGFLACTRHEAVRVEGHRVLVHLGIVQHVPVHTDFFSTTEMTTWLDDVSYQTLGITRVPLGIKYPLCTSSAIERCGTAGGGIQHMRCRKSKPGHTPRGTTTFQRNTSLTSASTYGSESLSANVGRRSLPMTASISACAFFCACGNSVSAKNSE